MTIASGALELPMRPARAESLPPLPAPEMAAPDSLPRPIRPGVVRLDRIGLEIGGEWHFSEHIDEDDPLGAVVEMRRTATVARDAWIMRIETHMKMSCKREAFLLQASVRAFEGTNEVCHRTWDRSIPRDLV